MELIQHYLLPCLWAFLACSGFCALYNIHGLGIVLCSLGGSLGWLVYLVAEARIRKCPASGYLLLAFFPLVPGAGVYYTVQAFSAGETERFLDVGRETLGIAGGLAIGVLLVSSVVRMLNNFLRKRKWRHASL